MRPEIDDIRTERGDALEIDHNTWRFAPHPQPDHNIGSAGKQSRVGAVLFEQGEHVVEGLGPCVFEQSHWFKLSSASLAVARAKRGSASSLTQGI